RYASSTSDSCCRGRSRVSPFGVVSRVTAAGLSVDCRRFQVASPPRTSLFPRDLKRHYRTISHGVGIRLYDTEGREYLDADSGAISVVSIGHGVEEVVQAMAEQARRVGYLHNGQFVHEVGEELARTIASHTPGTLNHSIIVSGGSEAVETAAKLARQYHLLRGNPHKD